MSSTQDPAVDVSIDALRSDTSTRLTPKPFATLDELPSEPPWIWDGMIAPGLLTMLSAPDFSGKSTLVGGLLSSLDAGVSFLGRSTKRTSAVLISEEPAVALRERRDLFDLRNSGSYFLGREEVASYPWPELIHDTAEWALKAGAQLLVIDTFAGLAGLQEEQENDAAAVMKHLKPLQIAAGQGLAVLFLHHTNRNGRARGSTAFGAAVDVAVRLVPKHGARFVLQTKSRFHGSPSAVAGRLHKAPDGWFYEALGAQPRDETAEPEATTDSRLLAALKQAGCAGLSYLEFDQLPGLSEDIAKKRLPAHVGHGVAVNGRGVKGDPLRYHLADAC